MLTLKIADDAKQDLRALYASDQTAWAKIVATLEEIQESQFLLDSLTVNGYGAYETEAVNVVELRRWRTDGNFWRLRIWEVVHYRIIYCFVPQEKTYHVLAIMPRETDYERDPEFRRRILNAYNNL